MIHDGRGQHRFRVDGQAFSWGDRLSFQDTSEREFAVIRQKLFALPRCGGTIRRAGSRHLVDFHQRNTDDVVHAGNLCGVGTG